MTGDGVSANTVQIQYNNLLCVVLCILALAPECAYYRDAICIIYRERFIVVGVSPQIPVLGKLTDMTVA